MKLIWGTAALHKLSTAAPHNICQSPALVRTTTSGQILQLFVINNVFPVGFRSLHITETALLKVSNDLLQVLDTGSHAVLVLLDLSAAFNTINHSILLHWLEKLVGIQGIALQWLASYLKDRTFSVGKYSSLSAPLSCGVPQGSILGPLLFTLYMLPLGAIFKKYKISTTAMQMIPSSIFQQKLTAVTLWMCFTTVLRR